MIFNFKKDEVHYGALMLKEYKNIGRKEVTGYISNPLCDNYILCTLKFVLPYQINDTECYDFILKHIRPMAISIAALYNAKLINNHIKKESDINKVLKDVEKIRKERDSKPYELMRDYESESDMGRFY